MSNQKKGFLANDLCLGKTITAAGTTGAQTINKPMGSVNFATAAASLVVTNSQPASVVHWCCDLSTPNISIKFGQLKLFLVSACRPFQLPA